MSKKKKRSRGDHSEPVSVAVSETDKTAEREMPERPAGEEEVPLELEHAHAAVNELSEDEPTRARHGIEDPNAALDELAEDLPTRTAGGEPLGASDVRENEGVADRFDFGGDRFDSSDEGPLRVGDEASFDEPPDPGSADAASPRLQSIVESLLFAADRPMGLRQLADLVEEPEVERIRAAVLAIEQSWRERGVQLHEVAGGYQFRTHPQNASWVQKLLQAKPVRLSRALLETLAIVSYRQPITRPEIDEIRGVDSGGTLKTLMDRALIRILGKKEEPGRPLLYGTTKEFLEFFSLRDLKDLPTLREYHELSEEHQAQVAALEGAAPEGSILADGEVADDEHTEALPKLSRLEISAPATEDAAELAAIDHLIRSAGTTSIATDSDLPGADPTVDPNADAGELTDDLAVTGKFNAVGDRIREREFDEEERQRTSTFGLPLPDVATAPEFEPAEATRLRVVGVDASLIGERDPERALEKEPDDDERE